MSNHNLSTHQPEDRDDEMKQRIAEERLFQASFSFKLAAIATASGAGSTVYFIKLAKDSNDRLDRIFEELND
jgi:hypothetical protein